MRTVICIKESRYATEPSVLAVACVPLLLQSMNLRVVLFGIGVGLSTDVAMVEFQCVYADAFLSNEQSDLTERFVLVCALHISLEM